MANVSKIKSLHTRSCGCFHSSQLIKRNTRHGSALRGRKPKEYNIWVLMKQRCYNPNAKGFKNWGGRGIEVCNRWKQSYENFIADMGNCPEDCRGIDRIKNNLGYYKENCRWATQQQQMRNTRRNRLINYNGETKTLSEWTKELNMPNKSYYYWMKKGLTDSEILDKYKATK